MKACPKAQENMNIKSICDITYKFKINPKNVLFKQSFPFE